MYRLIRPLLFCLDPERAHALVLWVLRYIYQPWVRLWPRYRRVDGQTVVSLWGLNFVRRLGASAGMDKNGICIDALLALGFGFIEVGGVTPHAQPGNPRPRIFRMTRQSALINRMNFPNDGVDKVVERLRARKLPGIIGVNIAKDSATPLELAAQDYGVCLERVYPHVDFVTVNMSCPNTPKLRELLQEEYLDDLLGQLQVKRDQLMGEHGKRVPLLIKISIDFPDAMLTMLLGLMEKHGMDGVITSNTSSNHSPVQGCQYAEEQGGLSGKPLFARNVQFVRRIHGLTAGKLPIIAVGGVFSQADVQEYIAAGASLVQAYTGFVYRGLAIL